MITCLLDETGGNPVEKKNVYGFMLEHPQYGARHYVKLKDLYLERI